jgi:LmbE family N-acetylglucosaminyl deacetylase
MGQLVGLMRELKPDVVITFEPFGWYGHPDHLVISRWVTAAYPLVAEPSAYPEMGQAWQPQRLFHSVLPFTTFQAIIREAKEAGIIEDGGIGDNLPEERQLKTEAQVTHLLDVRELFDTKQAAMWAHRTQFGEDNLFRKLPKEIMLKAWGQEHFIQVYPVPAAELQENRQSELFAA